MKRYDTVLYETIPVPVPVRYPTLNVHVPVSFGHRRGVGGRLLDVISGRRIGWGRRWGVGVMGRGRGCSVGGTLMFPLHPLNQQLLRMHVSRLIDLGDLLLDLFLIIMMVAMGATMDPVMVGDSFYPGARHVVGVVVGRLVVDYAMVAVGAHYGLAGESRWDEDGEGCHDDLKDTIVVVNKQYNTIQYNTIQYNTIQYNTIQCNTKHL